jgi:hypothetical protein
MSTPLPPRAVAPDLGAACDLAFCSGGPQLVGLTPDETGLLLVDGPTFRYPEDLLAWQVPRSWVGLVVVAGGRCRSISGGDASSESGAPPDTAHFAFALDRRGMHATFVTSASGTIRSVDGDRPAGHVVDVAHRLLDLPAPGAPADPRDLVAVRWLEELLDLSDDPAMHGFVDDWSLVAQTHPAFVGAAGERPSDLAAATRLAARSTDWATMLSAIVDDGWAFGHLGPDQLARLDAASFSRFVMARHLTVPELWALLEWRLSLPIAARVHQTLVTAGGTPPTDDDVRGHAGRAG